MVELFALPGEKMRFDSFIEIAVLVVTPTAIAYSWFFYAKKMHRVEQTWRTHTTFVALILVSLVVLLWPVMLLTIPKANWETGAGIDRQMNYVQSWDRIILWACTATLILSLFTKPRLILPLAIACFGCAYFWVLSTAP